MFEREHMRVGQFVFSPETATIRIGNAQPNVTSMTIDNHDLVTRLPDTVGQDTSLSSLTIINQPMHGLPDSIGNLTSLTSLIIYNTPITVLPESVGNLTNLKTLILVNTNLAVLPDLSRLTKLETLSLAYNHLTAYPTSTDLLPRIRLLDLTDNPIAKLPAEFPDNIASVPPEFPPTLSTIFLGNTKVPRTTLWNMSLPELDTFY